MPRESATCPGSCSLGEGGWNSGSAPSWHPEPPTLLPLTPSCPGNRFLDSTIPGASACCPPAWGCAGGSPACSQHIQLYWQNDFCPPSGHQTSRRAGCNHAHFHAATSQPQSGPKIPPRASQVSWAQNSCGCYFEQTAEPPRHLWTHPHFPSGSQGHVSSPSHCQLTQGRSSRPGVCCWHSRGDSRWAVNLME